MSSYSISIKKYGDKFQPYQYKQMRLISYLSGLPIENIKELIEEYNQPYVYQF